MTLNAKRVATLLVAMLMIASVMAMAPVAALESTEDSDFDSDDPITEQFNASDANDLILEVETDAGLDTESVEATVEYDDVDHLTVDDSDAAYEIDEEAGTDDADVHTWELTEADLETLPDDAGDETTFDVNVTHVHEDAEDEDADDDDMVEETLEFEDSVYFADEHASIYVDEASDSDTLEVADSIIASASMNMFGATDEIPIQSYDETAGIAGDNTTVQVHDATDNGTDAFDEAMDDLDDGDVALGAAATVDGTPVAVFNGEYDDDLVDSDEDTFVVYDSGQFSVYLGEDFEDEDEVDVMVDSQNALDAGLDADDVADVYADSLEFGFNDLRSEFGMFDTMWDLSVLPIIG